MVASRDYYCQQCNKILNLAGKRDLLESDEHKKNKKCDFVKHVLQPKQKIVYLINFLFFMTGTIQNFYHHGLTLIMLLFLIKTTNDYLFIPITDINPLIKEVCKKYIRRIDQP